MKILKEIIKRPMTILAVVVVALILGIVSTTKMPIKLLPDLNIPIVGVTVVYPGASADVIEVEVTKKVEASLQNVTDVTDVMTYSRENASIIVLSFAFGIDVDDKIKEINNTLQKLTLPSSCLAPEISSVDFNADAIAKIFVQDGANEEALRNLADRLANISGVGRVELKGSLNQNLVVEPIEGLEITSLLIVDALQKASLNLPLGSVTEDNDNVAIRSENNLITLEDLCNVTVTLSLPEATWATFKQYNRMINNIVMIANLEQTLYKLFKDSTLEEFNSRLSMLNLAKTIVGEPGPEPNPNWDPSVYVDLFSNSLGFQVNEAFIDTFYRFSKEELQTIFDKALSFKESHLDGFTDEEFIALLISLEIVPNSFNGYLDSLLTLDVSKYQNGEQISTDDVLTILKAASDLPFNANKDLINFIRQIDYEKIINNNYVIKLAEFNIQEDGSYVIEPVLANIRFEESYDSYAYYNGQKGIILEVYGKSNSNTSNIVKKVKEVLSDHTLEAILLEDQASFIDDSISNVLTSIIIGGILAIFIIYLFLKRIRTSLVISITMPLSILLALIIMHLLGISLNMVSLGGLAVGIGMLVDNSIVVIESITKNLEKDDSDVVKAALKGTKDVAGSLFASTLTTICVFIPIMFTNGLTKEIFTDLSWAVVLSLVFSLLVAILIIPTLFCLFHRHGFVIKKKETKPKTTLMKKIENKYTKFLDLALHKKSIVITLALVVFIASIALIVTRGTEFLPACDEGIVEVSVNFDNDDTVDEAKEETLIIYNEICSKLTGIKSSYASVGTQGLVALNQSGKITIQVDKKVSKTKDVVAQLREIVKAFPDKQISVSEVDGIVASITSGFNNLTVNISGDNEATLIEIAEKIEDKLLKQEGFTGVTNNLSSAVKEYKLKIDQEKCASLGIDYETILTTLRVGMAGYDSASINYNDQEIEVTVKFNKETTSSINSLLNMLVGANNEQMVLLKDFATVTEIMTKPTIIKNNGHLYLMLNIETTGIDTGHASKVIDEVTKDVLKMYDGYVAKASGVQSYLNDAFNGLYIALIVSIILLFVIMACQFGSFSKSLIVMTSIPLSFTGAFLFLAIFGKTLNVVSFIGIIMLMGVIVNNAIIMLDEIKRLNTEEQLDHYDAVLKGCTNRLRPILMTTLTTVLALIPLSLGLGRGGSLMQPMAIVVIGGLLVGTMVTLLLIPAIYCTYRRVKPLKKQAEEV